MWEFRYFENRSLKAERPHDAVPLNTGLIYSLHTYPLGPGNRFLFDNEVAEYSKFHAQV